MRVRVSLLMAALLAVPALAEQSAVNIHLDPGAGTGLEKTVVITGAVLKIDTTLIEALGPIAPQIEVFGLSAVNNSYLDQGAAFGAGIGVRLRLLNDEKGYWYYPGQDYRGTLHGNLWVDAHFTFTSGGSGPGFDVGAGWEASLVDGLSVGPFAKFMLSGPHDMLLFGVSFTVGAPEHVPAEADFDNDGILGGTDKCPDKAGPKENDGCPDTDEDKDSIVDRLDKCVKEAEDKDTFQDEDGCPDTDNDADQVLDADDKCPNEAGVKENNGCPDLDKDKDGLLDREDKCPAEAGPKENSGCPDTDKDGDTVSDRLDACLDVAGERNNKGCPWPDGDGDTVPDRYDNCPTESGPATNSGCPEKFKQLVVITKDKILIKEKVYFDTGKSTLQKRSNGLLDQLAGVLVGHTEITMVQIEGHTDNTGDAATNRTLSTDRAKAVLDYLVKKNVPATRLRSAGFGPDRPADTNDTPAGRDNNRRVEFNIIEE